MDRLIVIVDGILTRLLPCTTNIFYRVAGPEIQLPVKYYVPWHQLTLRIVLWCLCVARQAQIGITYAQRV